MVISFTVVSEKVKEIAKIANYCMFFFNLFPSGFNGDIQYTVSDLNDEKARGRIPNVAGASHFVSYKGSESAQDRVPFTEGAHVHYAKTRITALILKITRHVFASRSEEEFSYNDFAKIVGDVFAQLTALDLKTYVSGGSSSFGLAGDATVDMQGQFVSM